MWLAFEWHGSGATWKFHTMPDLLQQIGGATYTVRQHDDPTNRPHQRLATILDCEGRAIVVVNIPADVLD